MGGGSKPLIYFLKNITIILFWGILKTKWQPLLSDIAICGVILRGKMLIAESSVPLLLSLHNGRNRVGQNEKTATQPEMNARLTNKYEYCFYEGHTK